MSTAAEFSRPVPLSRLGAEPYRQRIEAGALERGALAHRFGLVTLDRLVAEVELVRETHGTILLSAVFEAAFEQECVVTLDPVAGCVAERFQLRLGTAEAEQQAPSGDDDPAFEPLESDEIDIGEVVAQEFSLSLPPFPRSPDAVVEGDAAPSPKDDGPFAALERFRRREPQ